ncbi:MAG TPA: sigma-70 family RNA polymerase sigma factor [Gaiellaceae bacterium]|jgi:RNA polymerase sigma-70 factor (ECF subfamily)|nr:sigma-70 family RNA polymerase sigma factor [Gaiellaceae bacterium]
MTFQQAAEAHLDDVYGYLAWFTSDRYAAEDLTAVTFERALRLWNRFDPQRGSARTWLCQIARTVALDHFRSERRRTRREELAAPPEQVDFRFGEGLSPDLEAALARLSAGEREVVALRVLLDLDAGTAARVLGISPTNCTTRLNRALKKLEEALHVAA